MEPTTAPASPPAPAPAPIDIELPACFYLGRAYDLAAKQALPTPIMYDARDLCTHGVVVGMTGSGKTGLCISLLEEAAIDGIPCIIIDPKGDLTNLLLQFPDLAPADFARWLDPEDARLKNMTVDACAAQMAERWRKGLADTLQGPERIQRLRDSSEWRIYTPGSEAGLPLSILKTFAAPQGKVLREELNQKIDATATALLGLTGTASDPVQSREHILIAQLLLHAWSRGKDLTLTELIGMIQAPPMATIGAFDVETFYPEKERLKLAIALNNILAAPSFSTWIQGESLDLTAMMHSSSGKPRQTIFYIAHLEEAQRIFFVTLLLEEVLSWTRKQQGTSSLRAILYFDEVFGYLPPHPANPPTKLPLMTMLKQARAFGVGVLLATQNPVDLDYKALSNAGTWFIGKLQTERDKARLLEGLEGAAAQQGSLTQRNYLEQVISALGSRVFLLHNIHRGQPVLLQTRQALCFLRGPMSREQVAQLMEPLKTELAEPQATAAPVAQPATPALLCAACQAEMQSDWKACPRCGAARAVPAARVADQAFKQELQSVSAAPGLGSTRPELPADVTQVVLPLSTPAQPVGNVRLVYEPRVLGVAEVLFTDARRSVQHTQTYRLLTEPSASVSWHTSERLTSSTSDNPVSGCSWSAVPDELSSVRKLKVHEKSLQEYLFSDARLTLLENSKLGLVSQPGEGVLAFQQRCRTAAEQEAAKAVAVEKEKYRPRFEALGAPMPVGYQPKESTLLDLVNPLSWLSYLGGTTKSAQQDKVDKLRGDWLGKQAAIVEKWRQLGEEYTEVPLRTLKKNITVTSLALAWAPFWHIEAGAGRVERVPAYR